MKELNETILIDNTKDKILNNTNKELENVTITQEIKSNNTNDLKRIMIIEAVKKINNPFMNWTVQEVMKDLKVSEATANNIFRRVDFPSVNIGKTKTVTLLAYLIWKMDKKESEGNNE